MCCPVSDAHADVWIGLVKRVRSAEVEWSDGSPVTLTFWHTQKPRYYHGKGWFCGKADRKVGPSHTHTHTPSLYAELLPLSWCMVSVRGGVQWFTG